MITIRHLTAFILMFLAFSACGGELKKEKQSVMAIDVRNGSVNFDLTSKGNNLQYCINDLSGDASEMDVFRVLLHTAELLKDRTFQQVELCFRKETRFLLGGEHFKVLGEEFETQNPVYTIRTFPEKLSLPDGQRAYEIHQGGVLYLMRVQMADFQDMNSKWFMNELVAKMRAEADAKRPKEFAPDEEIF